MLRTLVSIVAVISMGASPTFAKAVPKFPISQQQLENQKQADQLRTEGTAALENKQFQTASNDFQNELSLEPGDPVAYAGLAQALTALHQPQEALAVYKQLFDSGNWRGTSEALAVEMRYALLLDQQGNWAEACAKYNEALPKVPGGTVPKITGQFSPDNPQPNELAAAAHVAIGLYDSLNYDFAGNSLSHAALGEYQQALALKPNWAIANYCYGFGLEHTGHRKQAQAAYQKAADLSNGDVKTAAEKAAKEMN